ncbi:hypothetical protein HYV86_00940 [Candidatus Woesearchaeota archaeon]|nr:hypothetical protein [Candidatus Woesearchaeota archaeon]
MIPNTEHNFELFLKAAQQVAKQAGELILSYYNREYQVKIKNNEKDNIVTEVDTKTERLIVSKLKEQFPHHFFICEETKPPTIPQGAYVWIIDPLDGSRDFVKKTDDFAVQIGLLKEGKVLVGVVYLPRQDKLFHAVSGRGAYCNDQQIHVSSRKLIRECRAVASSRIKTDPDAKALYDLFHFGNLDIRGSFGLKIGLIASGIYDIVLYKKKSVKIWDVCAPLLILEEAGGKATLSNGSPIPLNPCILDYLLPIVLSNGECHQSILRILQKAEENSEE